MQYGTQLRATGEAEHRVGVLGAGGPGLQGRQATLVKIVQGIVDGLVSAVEVVRNRGGMEAIGTREQDLTAANSKGNGRAQLGLDGDRQAL